jgi:hypothetical protein
VAIQPPSTLKEDGGPKDAFFIDEQMLEEVTGKDAKVSVPYEEEPNAVELGKTYQDSITGFEGVAISFTKFLSASQRVGLQPTKLHEGKPIETQYFDAHQLNEVKSKVTPKVKESAAPGGPGKCATPPACARR